MKFLSVFFAFWILIVSCRPARNLQTSSASDTTAVAATTTKKDTATAIKPEAKQVDNVSVASNFYNKLVSTKINFATFNARARVGFNGSQGNGDATAIIRMKKDSVIWISLRGPLGIEGFRMLVTPDSVILMDLLKKNVQYKPISFLQQVTGIPFDLSTLQDLIIGNPVFTDSNIVSSQKNANELVLTMQGKLFKNVLSINDTDYKVMKSHLEKNAPQSLNCDINYNEYKKGAEGNFSTERSISVENPQELKSKMNVEMEFKQYEFNQAVTFPFNVSPNYKKL